MTTSTDSLARAIAYRGAVEVAPGRYAYSEAGRFWVVTENPLRALADVGPEIGNYFAYIRQFAVAMPSWWTPMHRSTFRCGCGKAPLDAKTNFALFAHCLGKGFERIAADLETGAEVPA